MPEDRVNQPHLDLAALPTHDPAVCGEWVATRFQEMFPQADASYIHRRFRAVKAMFAGEYEGFQPMDTAYHDLEHTLQATLCLVYLLYNRHRADEQPRITARDFNIALIAIMLHDMGYLKERDDTSGTGAKYTHIHEARSCRHARAYLTRRNWDEAEIREVERLIACTGPRSNIADIAFANETEKILGQAVCTADFIGQMSDPGYVDKLPTLYREFVESYDYQGLRPEERPFASYEQLLEKTPGFWEHFVKPRMTNDCGNVWKHLRDPATGDAPYHAAVERNIQRVRDLIGPANHAPATPPPPPS